jgi:hypothetical protein
MNVPRYTFSWKRNIKIQLKTFCSAASSAGI